MGDEPNCVSVTVKWMSKQFDNIELCLTEPLEVFKVQLLTLTGVLPERQKIVYKGKNLNSVNLTDLNIPNGAKLMLIGSAESLPENTEKIRFVEDMSHSEKCELLGQVKSRVLPAGLMNLGNTCYFNSVVQFLLPVEQIWEALETTSATQQSLGSAEEVGLVKSLLDLKRALPKTLERYVPISQVQQLRRLNPLFSRKDPKTGLYMQQDAEECLLTVLGAVDATTSCKAAAQVFGFPLVHRIRPLLRDNAKDAEGKEGGDASGSGEAAWEESLGHNIMLSCYVGTQLQPVGSLLQGIELFLNETLSKYSEAAGCNVDHEKQTRLSGLPRYLLVHLVRFEWKQQSDVSATDAVKAKVCRRIAFERVFDVTAICTEDVRRRCYATRAYVSDDGKDGNLSECFDLGNGEYATGYYELQSIVTHQGRCADGGHYICWSKKATESDEGENGGKGAKNEKWFMFDDDRYCSSTGCKA